jgi:hypothetical protein
VADKTAVFNAALQGDCCIDEQLAKFDKAFFGKRAEQALYRDALSVWHMEMPRI